MCVCAETGDHPDQSYAQRGFGSVFSNTSCRKHYSKVEALFHSGKRSFLFLCSGENLIRNPLNHNVVRKLFYVTSHKMFPFLLNCFFMMLFACML